MAIHSNGHEHKSQWINTEPISQYEHGNRQSTRRRQWIGYIFNKFPRSQQQRELHNCNSWSGLSVHRKLSRAWDDEPNNNSTDNRNSFRHRYHKCLHTVTLSLALGAFVTPASALAETVGGVSATASPIANSTGSVTNQAIQVLQGPYITNQYGDGISCQSPTLNVTPFVTGSGSFQKPYEPYYMDPVYDMRDLNEDGSLDNPGGILYHVPTRTGQKDNYNLSVGVSATWSKPLDKKQQELCKKAAENHNALREQILANRRLEFELTRLSKCGEMKKAGILFHPKSPYYSVCADVVVVNVDLVPPHRHTISYPTSSAKPTSHGSSHSVPASALGGTVRLPSSPASSQSSSSPSSR